MPIEEDTCIEYFWSKTPQIRNITKRFEIYTAPANLQFANALEQQCYSISTSWDNNGSQNATTLTTWTKKPIERLIDKY